MKSIAKALVSAAALAALSVQAQGPSSAQQGPYVGGSLGATKYKGDDVGNAPTDRSDSGGKVYGGYGFHPNFAVEAGYADLGKFSSDAGSVSGKGLYVDAVGRVPLTENVSALGRIGVFDGKAKNNLGASDSSTNHKVGLGLQYDLSEQTAIRGEWERYRFDTFGSKADTDMYSLGVNYAF